MSHGAAYPVTSPPSWSGRWRPRLAPGAVRPARERGAHAARRRVHARSGVCGRGRVPRQPSRSADLGVDLAAIASPAAALLPVSAACSGLDVDPELLRRPFGAADSPLAIRSARRCRYSWEVGHDWPVTVVLRTECGPKAGKPLVADPCPPVTFDRFTMVPEGTVCAGQRLVAFPRRSAGYTLVRSALLYRLLYLPHAAGRVRTAQGGTPQVGQRGTCRAATSDRCRDGLGRLIMANTSVVLV
jgi:hypothetical protein